MTITNNVNENDLFRIFMSLNFESSKKIYYSKVNKKKNQLIENSHYLLFNLNNMKLDKKCVFPVAFYLGISHR